jgi:hypothetical protein
LSPHGFLFGPAGDPQRRQVESFIMAFDSNMAPIVGQQITLTATNWGVASARIQLLMSRAAAGDCDLVAKANIGDEEAGFLYNNSDGFIVDRRNRPSVPLSFLRVLAGSGASPVTFTCAPPGSGIRMALDCDANGHFDGDDHDQGHFPYGNDDY